MGVELDEQLPTYPENWGQVTSDYFKKILFYLEFVCFNENDF